MAERSPRRRVLVVEDEEPIRELLRLHLDAAGFDVEECPDGVRALRLLRERSFDLIVLDVMLPGLDGVSLCRSVRGGGPNADRPIIMVTARDTESDKVIGLESGADDYIAKPFGIRELLARVTAVTRRHQRGDAGEVSPPGTLVRGSVVIDVERRAVTVRGAPVDLTRQEFDLLHRLAARRGVVLSRSALLQAVWSDDVYVTERTVDSVISRLRRKVEVDPRDPELILTAWGVGYKFNDID
jgi:DNA-binding response OmpR family regulator